MGLLDKFLKSSETEVQKELQSKQFEESNCAIDCGSCNFPFPKSVKIETEGNLWNSTKPYDMQIVIPTNRCDWNHDALADKSMKFAYKLNQWLTKHTSEFDLPNNTIKVNPSSLSSRQLEDDPEYLSGQKGDFLILPQFIWVKHVDIDKLDLLTPIIKNIAHASSKDDLKLGTIDSSGIQVSIDPNQAYVFLCSHRTRDKRCGITAPLIKKEIDLHTRDLGYYRDEGDDRPDGIKVGFINHIGGHKYAANVIIYLKKLGKNIWLARINPNNVKPIVDECILNGGKIWVENTRLIQKFKEIDW